MEALLVFILALVLTPITYVVNGWALSILWKWYIVPFGLPTLTVPWAIGVSIVIGFLTKQLYTRQCKDNRSSDEKLYDSVGQIIAGVIYPLVSLFIGWIVYQFVG